MGVDKLNERGKRGMRRHLIRGERERIGKDVPWWFL